MEGWGRRRWAATLLITNKEHLFNSHGTTGKNLQEKPPKNLKKNPEKTSPRENLPQEEPPSIVT